MLTLHVQSAENPPANVPHLFSSSLCENLAPTTVTVISAKNLTEIETTTKTQFTTVTAQPGTVTVALQAPGAISSSLSSAFSIESQQLEINSQLAPNNPFTSGRPPTATSATRFTRTIVVPIVEATKTPAASGQTSATDVYFIGESNGTTTWLTNFTPQESLTIGTTTVTLSPVASASANRTSRSRPAGPPTRTNTVTMTISRPDSLPPANGGRAGAVGDQGWNSSTLILDIATTSGYFTTGGGPEVPSSLRVVTVRRSSTVSATAIQPSASPTSRDLPTGAYGTTVNITFPTADYDYQKRSGRDGRRRAICEWVTATMRGTPVSWPNNWDGSKTVDCATVAMNTPQSQPSPCMYWELCYPPLD